MRIGSNPQKDRLKESNDFFHQLIIPVYIPNQEGYFKDSFAVLQLCLNSLFKTCHQQTYFTIINNGSSKEVSAYLEGLFRENKIQELIQTSNIGKLNAIFKGIAGQQFPIITITDADVLFLNTWQQETYAVFEAFPKTGSVSPTPNSKLLKYFTANVWFENLFSKSLQFRKVENPKAMQSFAESIGNPTLFNKYNLEKYATVSKNEFQAVVGSGHFVVTYRGSIFKKWTQFYSDFQLGGESENELLDKPVASQGYWRLATKDNYAYHMGNISEDWMVKQVAKLQDNHSVYDSMPKLTPINSFGFINWFKINIFSRIIFKKTIWKYVLLYKGLSKEEANTY
jgi:hypothetical protein